MTSCLDAWCNLALTGDALFRNRCAVCLDRGTLSAAAEYTLLRHLAGRSTLAPVQWARLIAGPCDIRQLTGQTCKNNDVDFYMLYRSSETAPITDFS